MCSNDPKPPNASDVAQATFEAATKYLPGLFDITNKAILPNEQATLAATKAVQPGYTQLASDILKGPGSDLIGNVLEESKKIDPEFFAARAAGGDAMTKLLSSIDLTGLLSGSEAAEMERNINRVNTGTGNTSGSAIGAAKDIAEFGKASTAKKEKQQALGTGALGAAAGFLPASRVGIDPLQVATGRPSYAPTIGAGTSAGAQNFFGASNEATGNQSVLNANRKSSAEKFLGAMPDYSG